MPGANEGLRRSRREIEKAVRQAALRVGRKVVSFRQGCVSHDGGLANGAGTNAERLRDWRRKRNIGASISEKPGQVIGQTGEASGAGAVGTSSAASTTAEVGQHVAASEPSRTKQNGQGCNGAHNYPDAIRVEVVLDSLVAGDVRPDSRQERFTTSHSPVC